MKSKDHGYVVGFDENHPHIVWGKLHFLPLSSKYYRIEDYCDTMTRKQAERAIKKMPPGAVVFKLVPVKKRGSR